jgi:hypothetical protein
MVRVDPARAACEQPSEIARFARASAGITAVAAAPVFLTSI